MQKTTKIKLRILLALFVAIVGFMAVMYSQIPMVKDVTLQTTSFYDEIVMDVDREIPSSSQNFKLMSAYYNIADVIATEMMLEKINKDERDSTLKYAQAAIIGCVKRASALVINGGKWTQQNMGEVYDNCGIVLGLQFRTKRVESSMNHYRDVVTKYRSALSVCASSRTYVSLARSRELVNSAATLLENQDMKRCAEVIFSLKSVKNNLYEAHLSNVKRIVSSGTGDANASCDELVANSKVYGKSKEEVENDLRAERKIVDQRNLAKTKKETMEIVNTRPKVDDDVW